MKKLTAAVIQLSILLSLCALPAPQAMASATVIYLTDTGATTWSVPSDWNNGDNTIEVIGAGGTGQYSVGAGGGAYSKKTNVVLTGGSTVSISIGAGGTTGGDTYLCDSTSNCASIAGSAVMVGAKGGHSNSGGAGGSSASGVGDVKYSGGDPSTNMALDGCHAGGGAAGPYGNGGDGGDVLAGSYYAAAGGGGGGGGSKGDTAPGGFNGAAGGNNHLGSGGGAANGFAGSNGGGGGGGVYGSQPGGPGGDGQEWDVTHGSGGGGGGTCQAGVTGGAGGLYGGGGASAGYNVTGGVGAQGIIVITYTPAAVARSTLARPANNLGLLAYYSMNEGSGAVVNDFSGNGYKATLVGASWVSGKKSKAISITDDNHYVGLPFSILTSLSNTTEITISTWFKGSDYESAVRLQPAANDYIVLGWGTPKKAIISTDGGTGGVEIPGVEDNRWHQVTMTWKRNTTNGFKIYVDGVIANQRDSADVNLPDFSTLTYLPALGRYTGTGMENIAGALDDVRIYNRELSAAEVRGLYGTGAMVVGGTEKTIAKGGLVGHWTFNGNDMNWSSASAGTAYDRSGQANDGTLTGMNQSSSGVRGKVGQGLYFDGVDDRVVISDDSDLDLTGDFTIATFYKTSSVDALDAIYTKGANGLQFAFGGFGGASGFSVCQSFVGCIFNDIGSYSLGVWQHTALTRQGDLWRLYVDGAEIYSATDSRSISNTVNAVDIGNDNASAGRYFNGMFDDYRIYNRALSATEIKQLHGLGTATIRQ